MSDIQLLEKLTKRQREALSVLVLLALSRPQLLDSTPNQHPDRLPHVLRQTFDVLKQKP